MLTIQEALASETLRFVRNWVHHCARPHLARLAFSNQIAVHRAIGVFHVPEKSYSYLNSRGMNTKPEATITFTEDCIEYEAKGVDIQFEYADPTTMDRIERLIKNL